MASKLTKYFQFSTRAIVYSLVFVTFIWQVQNNIRNFQNNEVVTEFSTQNLSNSHFPKISLCPEYMFNPKKLIKFGLKLTINEELSHKVIPHYASILKGINSSFTFAQLYKGAKWHLHDIIESLKFW